MTKHETAIVCRAEVPCGTGRAGEANRLCSSHNYSFFQAQLLYVLCSTWQVLLHRYIDSATHTTALHGTAGPYFPGQRNTPPPHTTNLLPPVPPWAIVPSQNPRQWPHPQQQQQISTGYVPPPAVPGGHFLNFPNMHLTAYIVPSYPAGSLSSTGYPLYHHTPDHRTFQPTYPLPGETDGSHVSQIGGPYNPSNNTTDMHSSLYNNLYNPNLYD